MQQDDDLLGYVYEKCSSTNESNLETSGVLKELVEMCLKSSKITFIILDGLDECKKGEAEKIVLWLTSLLEKESIADSGSIRLLCASQRDGTLDKVLSQASTFSLENHEHQKDIESYARQWSFKIRQKFDITVDLENDIATRVASLAAGK